MALDLGVFLEGAGSSFKVKVTKNDAVAQYLKDKLFSSDASVTITETNDGSTEKLDIKTAGSPDTNIANTDLTQDGDRTVTQDGYDLHFDEGVAIGTTTLDSSAYLEIGGSQKGLLIPRMTTSNMNGILTPATNLIIYNTDLNALYRYDGANWVALAAGFGIVGVNDANGQPTYYATLASAYSAASAGDVVKLYSDVTESGGTTIDLKDEVTLDLNGHTYTFDSAGSNNVFNRASSGSLNYITIKNGRIIKTGGGSGATINNDNSNVDLYLLNLRVTSDIHKALWSYGRIYCYGSVFEGTASVNNSTVLKTYSGGELHGGKFICNGSGATCHILVDTYGARFVTNGGYYAARVYQSVDIVNCTFQSVSNSAVYIQSGAKLYNCYAYSVSSVALNAVDTSCEMHNCQGYSGSNHAFTNYGRMYNCTAVSGGARVVSIRDGAKIVNSTVIVESGTGNAIECFGPASIIKCYLEVADSSAVGIDARNNDIYVVDVDVKGTTTHTDYGTGSNLWTATKDSQGNSANL